MKQTSFLSRTAALAVLAIALLTLVGWLCDIDFLKRIEPSFAAMKPATALCFLLSGCGLLLLMHDGSLTQFDAWARRDGGRFCAVLVGLLGLAALIESGFNVDLRIGGVLLRKLFLAGTNIDPGRMSPVTAWSFLVIATALLLLDTRSRSGYRPAQYLALVVICVGTIATAGYIYGVQGLYHSAAFCSIALHSAISFMLIGAAIFFARPAEGLAGVITTDHAGGWMARHILPITTLMPFVLGALRTQGERAGLYQREMGLAIFVTINIAIMAIIIWRNARSLNRIDARRREGEAQIQSNIIEMRRANERLQAEISRRQEAQEALRLANESLENKVLERTNRLQEANQELESFSYSVSHDLRSPLRSIDGFSRLLLEKSADKLDETERKYLDCVCTNSKHMGHLIEDLLNLSQVTRCSLTLREVDLSALALEIIDDLRRMSPERKVDVVIQPGLTVSGDKTLLRNVLVNLLGNAWKFTGKTKGARITFGCVVRHNQRVYEVGDNGAGFDMEYATRLFGAFQRLHTTQEFEGHGVGLATVHRIIRRHDGDIWADGKVNAGATFSFTLHERATKGVRNGGAGHTA